MLRKNTSVIVRIQFRTSFLNAVFNMCRSTRHTSINVDKQCPAYAVNKIGVQFTLPYDYFPVLVWVFHVFS